jgi:predicted ATPase/transcriptional regulator with XRE-family HTH domain
VAGISLCVQAEIRSRLVAARDQVRGRRSEVMLEIGRLLRVWRDLSGILQQDLAAEGCVSATVVRRIEKGDYESPPPESLIAAVARQSGPARELGDLSRAFRLLQGQQKKIDKLLARKVLPGAAADLAARGDRLTLAPGLAPSVVPRSPAIFAGRLQELGKLERLLDRQRLVTVAGPGGIGKTALCLRFAESRAPGLAGPWFADLSGVQPGEPLFPLLGRLILDEDDGDADGDGVAARLAAALGELPALIIFDNCEHLESAAAAVAALLSACPGASVLATSREPLHVPGEAVMTLGPLPVIEKGASPDGRASQPADAVGLFTRLLGNARGDESEPDPDQAAAVTALCRRLDGIPLSIELAAARARTVPVRDIADSVQRGVAILSGGRRDIPRHQAIEATITWSWDLLTRDEQRALSRLAILTAPFTFRCGAHVAADDPESGERLVAALADKSLLSADMNGADDARFRALGVVRTFAAARLSTQDREAAVRQLMRWVLSTAQVDDIALQQPGTVQRLDADLPHIRTALELSDSPADQIRAALAIWPFWHIRSLSAYGCQFLAKARDEDIPLDSVERGTALGTLAGLLTYQGRDEEALDAAERSIAVRSAILHNCAMAC